MVLPCFFAKYTDTIAWIWREGIGKFPPNPEAKKKRISHERRRREWEILFDQPPTHIYVFAVILLNIYLIKYAIVIFC